MWDPLRRQQTVSLQGRQALLYRWLCEVSVNTIEIKYTHMQVVHVHVSRELPSWQIQYTHVLGLEYLYWKIGSVQLAYPYQCILKRQKVITYKSGKCLPKYILYICTYVHMWNTVETEQQRVQFKHTVMQLIMGQCTYVSRVITRWIKAICMAALQAIWSSVWGLPAVDHQWGCSCAQHKWESESAYCVY